MASADVEAVREWTGSEPDDTTVEAALARFPGDRQATERAALAILRRRQADQDSGDGAVSEVDVDGDYRERYDVTGRSKRLDSRIAQLAALLGEDLGTGLGSLTSAAVCAPGWSR